MSQDSSCSCPLILAHLPSLLHVAASKWMRKANLLIFVHMFSFKWIRAHHRLQGLQSVICVVCSEVATPLICPNKSLWLSNGLSVWTCFEVCCGGPKIDNRHNFNHKFKGRPHVALPGFIYLRTSRQEHLLFHMPEESGHHPALIWPKDRPLGRSCVSAAGSRFAAWTGGECHGIRRKNAHGIHVEGVF